MGAAPARMYVQCSRSLSAAPQPLRGRRLLIFGAVGLCEDFAQAGEAVLSLDGTDGTGGGTHDQRLGGHGVLAVANAAQQLAVGDTGCGEEAVIAGDQVVGGQHTVQIVAGFQCLFALCVIGRCQAALDDATGCLDSAGCDNAFGSASRIS